MSARVILVDDSEIVLARLQQILHAANDIRVVRTLRSLEGVDLSRELSAADVIILDLLMPGRSGLAALDEVAAQFPVIVVSDEAADSGLAAEALARGARTYFTKRELADAAAQERLRGSVRHAASRQQTEPRDTPVLAIVGSTGAHRALGSIAPALSKSATRCVVLQHMPEGGAEHFATWLTRLGTPARLAQQGTMLSTGHLSVAAAGHHIEIGNTGRIRLRPPRDGDLYVPSGDILLSSLVASAAKVTAVVLSGLGRDAAQGAAELEEAGGRILVQDPAECVASSMPLAALEVAKHARAFNTEELVREVLRVSR